MRALRSSKGASATEYGLLIGLVAILAIVALLLLGRTTSDTFETSNTVLSQGLDDAQGGGETVAPPPVPPAADPALTGPMTLVYRVDAGELRVTMDLGAPYDVTLDWGDAAANAACPTTLTATGSTVTPIVCTGYGSGGDYTVTIDGNLNGFGGINRSAAAANLVSVVSWGDVGLVSLNRAFENANLLESLPGVLPPTVRDMSRMFVQTTGFGGDLSVWDVSNVESTHRMFWNATNFNGNLGGWRFAALQDASYMFDSAVSFNQDLSGWTMGSVSNLEGMFANATAFNGAIGGWDVSNAQNMTAMFAGAQAFNQDIGAWDVSGVDAMEFMFGEAASFN